jgi:ABC-2 type transport system ATP-binding protein
VLLSSHLLHEIEVIADDLVVIGNGHIVAAGTKSDLLAAAGTFAGAADLTALASALTRAGHTAEPSLGGLRTDADAVQVGRIALAAGVPLTELRPADGAGLEEMFLELTQDNAREEVAA